MQDIIAQFTNSANAAGQLNNQVSQEAAATTAQIVGSAESGISAAVNTANTIVNQVRKMKGLQPALMRYIYLGPAHMLLLCPPLKCASLSGLHPISQQFVYCPEMPHLQV